MRHAFFTFLIVAAVVLASCASGRDQRDGGPQGSPGQFSQGPGDGPGQGQSRGGPGGADMSLMKLKGLLNQSDSALAITAAQASSLLPILQEWKSKLANLSQTDAQGYAGKVEAVFTAVQKNYRPQPPQGGPGSGPGSGPGNDQGNDQGNPPAPPSGDQEKGGGPGGQGGPGGPNMAGKLLDEVITSLSKLAQ